VTKLKKFSTIFIVGMITLLSLSFAMIVKADDSGKMILTSEKDAAWTDYTYFSKPNKTIDYKNNNNSSGTFTTTLQTKGLFGYKNISNPSKSVFESNTKQEIIIFNYDVKGNYRFYTQWKSGTLNLSYSTYSSNPS